VPQLGFSELLRSTRFPFHFVPDVSQFNQKLFPPAPRSLRFFFFSAALQKSKNFIRSPQGKAVFLVSLAFTEKNTFARASQVPEKGTLAKDAKKLVFSVIALVPRQSQLLRPRQKHSVSPQSSVPLMLFRVRRCLCYCAPRWSHGTAPLSWFLQFRCATSKKPRQGLAAPREVAPTFRYRSMFFVSPALLNARWRAHNPRKFTSLSFRSFTGDPPRLLLAPFPFSQRKTHSNSPQFHSGMFKKTYSTNFSTNARFSSIVLFRKRCYYGDVNNILFGYIKNLLYIRSHKLLNIFSWQRSSSLR